MPGDDTIRILFIEDYPADVILVKRLLAKDTDVRFEMEQACTLRSGLERLAEGGIDVVLLDLGLPDSRGLETLAKVRTHSPQVPVIVLTGFSDQIRGIKALLMGAHDYLVKGIIDSDLLGRAIVRATGRVRATKRAG